MSCRHTGFHSITSRYDRVGGTLVYLRVCARCGAAVAEVGRVSYRPRYEPEPCGASAGPVEYGPAATATWRASFGGGRGPGSRDGWSEPRDGTKPDSGDGRVRVASVQ
jgi:hypothetical protein